MKKKILSILLVGTLLIGLTGCGAEKTKKHEATDMLGYNVKVGDYIRFVPENTSYTISSSLTGYPENQTINPSELTIWRVIKINLDNSVDVVSQYLPTNETIFTGLIGYNKFVGSLNTIASQYTKEGYVISARNIGFESQQEDVSNVKAYNEFINKSWEEIKSYVKLNGSVALNMSTDESYKEDTELVQRALGRLGATPVPTDDKVYSGYWRYYISSRNAEYKTLFPYLNSYVRYVDGPRDNEISQTIVYSCSDSNSNGGCENGSSTDIRIRPIITLSPTIDIISGDGSSENTAYELKKW